MSEHKLPQAVRQARGLVGIRTVARDADPATRRAGNRAARTMMGMFRALFPAKGKPAPPLVIPPRVQNPRRAP